MNRRIYLGDAEFVTQRQDQADAIAKRNRSVPKAQRVAPKTLAHWLRVSSSREQALHCAHVESGITMTALAAELGLTVARVSQLIAREEAKKNNDNEPVARVTRRRAKESN